MKTGFLFVDKPVGKTSFQVVSAARRVMDTKKCGHAGTLDPAATGLLIVAVGRATRLLRFLTLEPKTYTFEVVFGVRTNTDDDEGEVVETQPTEHLDARSIAEMLKRFDGEIDQVPPIFSAIHIDGERAYIKARKGEEVEMPTRRVTVHSIELHRYEECVAYCEASVSTGTYIRAIARDLGSLLGSAAHARNIRRTQIERVSVEDAVSLDDLSTDHLVPPRDLLPLAEVVLDDDELARIQKGLPIEARDSAVEEFVALIHSNALIGVAETTDVGLQPRVVFPTDN